MDLKKLDTTEAANNGSELHLTHPATGYEIEGLKIKLKGADSDVYRNEIKRRAEQSMGNGRKKQKIDLDDSERKGAELLAKLTVGWQGFEEGKEKLECTFENCVRIYLKYRWIRDQAEQFISDRANFLKA